MAFHLPPSLNLISVSEWKGDHSALYLHLAQSQIEALQAELEEADKRIFAGDQARRKMHNIIQELKGNIRVYCRVRPLIASETVRGSKAHFELRRPSSSDSVALTPPSINSLFSCHYLLPQASIDHDSSMAIEFPESEDPVTVPILLKSQPRDGGGPANSYVFGFDAVFGPDSSQGSVFKEISELVQSALDGQKVCIFAYGQTGSGKTFTVWGLVMRVTHVMLDKLNPQVCLFGGGVMFLPSLPLPLFVSLGSMSPFHLPSPHADAW